ncbi:MAG TPA: kinase-associated lipoprotein B [Bacillales bacterium]|nr:kinase-associated lipoprotein B [Bacillales bacterium]
MNKDYAQGDLVYAIYKTGKYIGEIAGKEEGRVLVKIRAVLRHPTQGDLHYPNQVNVAFQQRRALAEFEKTWVHPASIKPFEGKVPDYNDSLRNALDAEITKLKEKNNDWAQKSIEMLEDLRRDYFKRS